MVNYKKIWKRHAIIGVTLVGLGVNFIGEAIIIKSKSPIKPDMGHMALWFWIGLIGIVSLNAGICFIADAAKNRVLMEIEKRQTV